MVPRSCAVVPGSTPWSGDFACSPWTMRRCPGISAVASRRRGVVARFRAVTAGYSPLSADDGPLSRDFARDPENTERRRRTKGVVSRLQVCFRRSAPWSRDLSRRPGTIRRGPGIEAVVRGSWAPFPLPPGAAGRMLHEPAITPSTKRVTSPGDLKRRRRADLPALRKSQIGTKIQA
jgi:hypothetical protein